LLNKPCKSCLKLKQKIAVIGQGYVGLPLAIAAAEAGFYVNGLETNEDRVTKISSGVIPIEDLSSARVNKQIELGRYRISNDFSVIKESSVILICVPTPLNANNQPDLSFLNSSVTEISRYLSPGTLVILESTVEPGTTRNILLPALTYGSGLNSDQVDVAFSPERIDPTNKVWNLKTTPKIVSGITELARKRASEFYSKFINTVIECDSPEIAETAKLIENSFRLVNISFINEISIFCNRLGIDVEKVIEAASTKPYGFMPFYPSIGVGGHCIPVDPIYLANAAKSVGVSARFIELADQINQEMPGYFVGRAEEKLTSLQNKKILVVGVSYKPNVADVRETPVEALIFGLKNKGAETFWHDDLVKDWNGEKSVALSNKYDLAILATPHDYLDLTKLGDVPILNTRGSN